MKPKKALIIVVGPTASGKSELAVKLAKSFAKQGGAEIVSADSRQVYKGLDIGSGKIEGKTAVRDGKKVYLYKGIPHHLIDVASPLRQYSVAKYQKAAFAAIKDILKRGKTPIICGGTAHWVDSVVFGQALPEVKPNYKLRAKLSSLTTTKAFKLLQKLDPVRAKNIDAKNPRRLVRALEIVMETGKAVPQTGKREISKEFKDLKIEWIGLNPGMEVLEKNIQKRLHERFKQGLLKEVEKLHSPRTGTGLSWKRLESFGLEYKFCALFLQKKITHQELYEQLYRAIRQYAKRQMTWWKRNKDIQWFEDAKKVQM